MFQNLKELSRKVTSKLSSKISVVIPGPKPTESQLHSVGVLLKSKIDSAIGDPNFKTSVSSVSASSYDARDASVSLSTTFEGKPVLVTLFVIRFAIGPTPSKSIKGEAKLRYCRLDLSNDDLLKRRFEEYVKSGGSYR